MSDLHAICYGNAEIQKVNINAADGQLLKAEE